MFYTFWKYWYIPIVKQTIPLKFYILVFKWKLFKNYNLLIRTIGRTKQPSMNFYKNSWILNKFLGFGVNLLHISICTRFAVRSDPWNLFISGTWCLTILKYFIIYYYINISISHSYLLKKSDCNKFLTVLYRYVRTYLHYYIRTLVGTYIIFGVPMLSFINLLVYTA